MSVEPARALTTDLQDERLTSPNGIVSAVRAFVRRVRGGDLGSLPVIKPRARMYLMKRA